MRYAFYSLSVAFVGVKPNVWKSKVHQRFDERIEHQAEHLDMAFADRDVARIWTILITEFENAVIHVTRAVLQD